VTAGPTEEPIDPVRVITNASSGRMGYAVARAAREAGARASDAVFAAVAAAAWNSVTAHAGVRPEHFPARETAAARALAR
jgi:phosphopantothenoylcysteine decarboxylase/phosphopantothenate--cysteine ligase